MPNPVVAQIQAWSQTYRDCADSALNAATSRYTANPSDAALELDYKQALQYHSSVLLLCGDMLTAAMQIVANDATNTLSGINNGTSRLNAVLNNVSTVQRVVDVLADLVTTVTDVVAAVSTLSPAKVLSAVKDLQTLVNDTVGGGAAGGAPAGGGGGAAGGGGGGG
jgi:uncharacterized membrane protein YgcG